MSNEPVGAPLTIEIPTENLPPPEVANFFYFSFSGPEIQLLVGFIDLNVILKETGVAGTPGTGNVRPEITRRIVMSSRGFSLLREQFKDISEKWDQAAPLRAELK